jgi:putative transposase
MKKGTITLRCILLDISRSAYYEFSDRKMKRTLKDTEVTEQLQEIAETKKFKLGIRGLTMAYQEKYKIVINHKKVRRIKSEYHIPTRIRQKRWRKPIQPQRNALTIVPDNILGRMFTDKLPLKKAGTDVTYLWIPRLLTFAYLANVRDMATSEYLGWGVSFTNDQELANSAVLDTIYRQGEKNIKNLILQMDQGGTYTSPNFQRDIVDRFGIIPSMSRKGNCIDNAPTESGHGHLKDWFDFRECRNLHDVTSEVNRVIEYFNNERPQWNRKKMTPKKYRNHLLAIEN